MGSNWIVLTERKLASSSSSSSSFLLMRLRFYLNDEFFHLFPFWLPSAHWYLIYMALSTVCWQRRVRFVVKGSDGAFQHHCHQQQQQQCTSLLIQNSSVLIDPSSVHVHWGSCCWGGIVGHQAIWWFFSAYIAMVSNWTIVHSWTLPDAHSSTLCTSCILTTGR